MKKVLFTALVLIALVGVGISAQSGYASGGRGQFPGCPLCGVFSYVDLPEAEATVSQSNFTIQGWGFECVGGNAADRVDLWFQNYDGTWSPLKQAEGTLSYGFTYRPDVQAAYQPWCPNVTPYSGWILRVSNPPPVGLRRVIINVWKGPYFEQHQRTYLVTP